MDDQEREVMTTAKQRQHLKAMGDNLIVMRHLREQLRNLAVDTEEHSEKLMHDASDTHSKELLNDVRDQALDLAQAMDVFGLAFDRMEGIISKVDYKPKLKSVK
jgi:hypothetical protein